MWKNPRKVVTAVWVAGAVIAALGRDWGLFATDLFVIWMIWNRITISDEWDKPKH